MARSTWRDEARPELRAAERLGEINREVAAILRTFPDLRSLSRVRPRRRLIRAVVHPGAVRMSRRASRHFH